MRKTTSLEMKLKTTPTALSNKAGRSFDSIPLAMRLSGAINFRCSGLSWVLSPQTALALGLKVDSEALPASVVEAVRLGKVNLNDPAVTLQLIRQNAVLGVVGTFNGNTLSKVGFTCALCHSTVDNSVAPGIGKRIDGLANRDLNVGAIVATAPNLQPVVNLLSLAPQDAGIRRPGRSQRAQ